MTPVKKNPTNSDLLKEIEVMQATLTQYDRRLYHLEIEDIERKAHEAALRQVRKEERDNRADSGSVINKELLKALGLALTALVSLAAFIQASR